MRRRTILDPSVVAVALLLLFSHAAQAQEPAPAAHRLALTAQLENQEYCLQPNGRTTLRLSLRLHFENVSREKILLSEKSNVVDSFDIVALPANGSPQPWPHIVIDRLVQHRDLPFPASPGDDYAILKPGKSFHTNTAVHIDLLHSKLDGDGPVKPGKYSLAVTVATWLDTDSGAETARQLWKKSGYLESDDVTSTTIGFSVAPDPPFHDCGWRD